MSNLQTPEVIRQWHIYKITNPTGAVYIGKTSNISKRLHDHRKSYRDSFTRLKKSIIEYGFENHSFEIIDTFSSSRSYSNSKEIFWIKTYMSCYTQYPENQGLNSTPGGTGGRGTLKGLSYNTSGVNQYDINGNFIASHKSIRDLCDSLGVRDFGIIRKVCTGKKNTYKGYKFKYKE